MGVKVAAAGCFQWSSSQPIIPQSHPPSSQTTIPSPSSSSHKRRSSRSDVAAGGVLTCRYVGKSALFGTTSTKLHRTRSYDQPPKPPRKITRSSSSNLDAFSDEEFSKKIHELALSFHENHTTNNNINNIEKVSSPETGINQEEHFSFQEEPQWKDFSAEWQGRDDIVIERKANSVDLPFSLRIIKRKMRWDKGFLEAGESAYCSIKKAFSSMVFIIRELHSYSLKLREELFTENLQGILVRVHKEMNDSFVWLFQQVFSHTPTLMVYVMILLANFTVHSMGSNVFMDSHFPPVVAYQESVITNEDTNHKFEFFDSSSLKGFSVFSTSGKSTSIGGNSGSGGGGSKVRPVASGTEGDGHSNRSDQRFSQLESVSGHEKEELSLWDSILEESSRMHDLLRGELLDRDTVKRFVSPVTAKIEPEDYLDYFGTELLYQVELSQDPNNALLLANYAQFLYIVAHDYDRAEECFKKAIGVEPKDAEAYNKYAIFLWRARNDLWAAEETFLEAINVEPSNSSYAANYAHFLWNTGGEDTCFPIDYPDTNQEV